MPPPAVKRMRLLQLPLRPAILSLGLAFLVVGAVASLTGWRMREEMRARVMERDADVLDSVARLLLAEEAHRFPGQSVAIRESNLLAVALRASTLDGVVALRIFLPGGELLDAVPDHFLLSRLSPDELAQVLDGRPLTRFLPQTPLDRFLEPMAPGEFQDLHDLLEVAVPLRHPERAEADAVGQFLLDGRAIRQAFTAIDRGLWAQTLINWLAGGLFLTLGMWWVLGRLHRVNRALAAQTEELKAVNRELAFSARTSAVGALAAHLVHGLKNPLHGLRQYLEHGWTADSASGEDLEVRLEAVDAARRMNQLLEEVVEVLQDDSGLPDFSLSISQVMDSLRERFAAGSGASGPRFSIDGQDLPWLLSGRDAGLLSLALRNLVENAFDALGGNGEVSIRAVEEPSGRHVAVIDSGPGLPPERRTAPFSLRPSAKPGGAGLGLAISAELVRHLGGRLVLHRTGPEGTEFRLLLP